MGKQVLECCVAVKGRQRGQTARARFPGALSKKVTVHWTAVGL